MKLVKSLLLGTVAGMASVAGAQAADLPFRKAAPVDYVRVCDWVGVAGYFYVPGTDTCLRVGGEVRFEYAFVDQGPIFAADPFGGTAAARTNGTFTPLRATNASGFLGRAQIEVDSRTQTAYGLLRAFGRLQGNFLSGNESTQFGDTASNATGIDKAYITFAGLTAGRIQSFFDLYADAFNYGGIANSDQSTEVLAYTATFGGGFSATISVENQAERRDGVSAISFGANSINSAANIAGGALGSKVGFAGYEFPDAVAQLRYEQSWGAIQISGAYHDINTISTSAVFGPNGYSHTDEAGFAVQAGIDVKLPMIAAGDEVFLEGAYQNGAYKYMDAYGNMSSGGLIRGFQHQDVDAVAVGTGAGGYRLALSDGFSVMGAFHHYFTPQFHDILFGSYEEVSYGNSVRNIDWRNGGIGDASQYKIGNQFVFTPAHNLDIGVEVLYAHLDQDLAGNSAVTRAALNTALGRPVGANLDNYLNPDSFQVRLRLNRDF